MTSKKQGPQLERPGYHRPTVRERNEWLKEKARLKARITGQSLCITNLKGEVTSLKDEVAKAGQLIAQLESSLEHSKALREMLLVDLDAERAAHNAAKAYIQELIAE